MMAEKADSNIELIYILGSSYSGSTLLSIFLGASPKVNCAGELKKMEILHQERMFCTCGNKINRCRFWEKFLEKYKSNFGTSRGKKMGFQIFSKMLFGLPIKFPEEMKKEELETLHLLKSVTEHLNPDCRYIADTSKSLWRLLFLETLEGVNIKVLRLRRSTNGNVASFMKRGHSFIKSLFILVVNNFLIDRYLKTTTLPFLELSYDDFVAENQAVMDQIGDFLNVDYSVMDTKWGKSEIHIPAGNDGTMKQIIRSSILLKKDDGWKNDLIPIQKLISSWF